MIGSAAVALHGVDPGPVGDVDLLTDAADARALLAAMRMCPDDDAPRTRFRSVYGRWPVGPLRVEVMGGLEVATEAGWQPVVPTTREHVTLDAVTIFVPARAELAAIMRCFARPKDLARAALLAG